MHILTPTSVVEEMFSWIPRKTLAGNSSAPLSAGERNWKDPISPWKYVSRCISSRFFGEHNADIFLTSTTDGRCESICRDASEGVLAMQKHCIFAAKKEEPHDFLTSSESPDSTYLALKHCHSRTQISTARYFRLRRVADTRFYPKIKPFAVMHTCPTTLRVVVHYTASALILLEGWNARKL